MKNLLEFLHKYHQWFLFVLFEALSMVLLFQFNNYQGSVWFTTANALAGKVYEWDAAVESFFTMSRNNEQLTKRNFYQERQLNQLRRLYQEATPTTDPKELAELEKISQYKLIPAKVVTSELHKKNNLMTINAGRADGVEPGMGVACGQGVVGVTFLSSDHYTVVIPVLNSTSSRISCTIRNRGYFGVLRWYGQEAGYAYVEDIPRHARFKRGEWVETNGYSSIFPAGCTRFVEVECQGIV